MLKRILAVWLMGNLLVVAADWWWTTLWYTPRCMPAAALAGELALITLANLVLPILVLKRWWPEPVRSSRDALGWSWNGARSVLVGASACVVALGLAEVVRRVAGQGIRYQLPGSESAMCAPANSVVAVVELVLFLAVIVMTIAGDETLFRGLIQTQIGGKYGPWTGLLLGGLLYGLRDLPQCIYYGSVWHATPQMWATRQLEICCWALVMGLARRYGRSTYASAIARALMCVTSVFV